MTTETTDNIIIAHLRALRDRVDAVSDDVNFLKEGQISIRNQVNELRGDLLRFEQRTETRLDRIEKRISLADA